MPTYAKLCALSLNIDVTLDLAIKSRQTLAAYLLEMASLEVSQQIEKLKRTSLPGAKTA
jgi:hypothetical protein